MGVASVLESFSVRPSPYGWFLVSAILMTSFYWIRRSRKDARLPLIYFGALGGAFAGAKVAYLISEGWLHLDAEDWWLHWATGKSVTGALLGGYLGVEGFKKLTGYPQTTGDRFALVVPLGVIVGRLGCLSHGCCAGIACRIGPLDRWPAVPVEIAFNAAAWVGILMLHRRKMMEGQLFHLYLMAYGAFRFGHEFLREAPKPFLGMSGYQIISLILVGFAWWRFVARRASEPGSSGSP